MADFVRGNPQGDYPAEIIDGIFMHRRIDVMTDNLAEVKEARSGFARRPAASPPSPSTSCGIIFLSQHWAQLSPDLPWTSSYATPSGRSSPSCPTRRPASSIQSISVVGALAGALSGNGFIQRVLNGMASRRPRLEALRDSAGSGYPLRPSGDAVLALLSADDAPGRKQTAVIATSLIGKSWLNDC